MLDLTASLFPSIPDLCDLEQQNKVFEAKVHLPLALSLALITVKILSRYYLMLAQKKSSSRETICCSWNKGLAVHWLLATTKKVSDAQPVVPQRLVSIRLVIEVWWRMFDFVQNLVRNLGIEWMKRLFMTQRAAVGWAGLRAVLEILIAPGPGWDHDLESERCLFGYFPRKVSNGF